ncbi:MAG TPA: MlaD family protein [Verrucomicrobiae bacterium]|jgi:phospholipid/cholesterol/gamma-HCH transport system substrate-binding protein|nr:MlaD family protein [Verrucomicrobiae bacterium]
MKNTLETRLGMFVLLAMISAFLIMETLGTKDIFKPGYNLRAQFGNISELKKDDPVKMAGVPVGHVEKIALVENKVELTLRLDKEAPVKTDSKATIKFAGLMGANYVSIDFGTPSAPRMAADQLLQTVEQPDISQLLAKLDDVATGVQNITKTFTGDKIDNLLGPFTDFMKQNNPRLSAIIANFQGVSAQIAQGKGTVGKLIYDDALYNSAMTTVTNLQETAGDARQTIAKAQTIIDQVNAGQGTVGKLIKDDALYKETTASMTNLKEILQKINRGQGSVGKLVNDQEFYNNAKLTLQKLDKATEGLEDQGPLSVVGTMVQTLF